jgi:hypothetical protein
MARSSECTDYYAHKVVDTAGIVRDGDVSPEIACQFATNNFLFADYSALRIPLRD